MSGLRTMLEAIATDLTAEVEHFGRHSRLTVGLGSRHQAVDVRVVGDECVLTSIVLPAADVTSRQTRWRDLARLAWQRNAETDVVAFTFDEKDRLVGRVRHPLATLDPEELELYVRSLVRECDRFEYLLSGTDRN